MLTVDVLGGKKNEGEKTDVLVSVQGWQVLVLVCVCVCVCARARACVCVYTRECSNGVPTPQWYSGLPQYEDVFKFR